MPAKRPTADELLSSDMVMQAASGAGAGAGLPSHIATLKCSHLDVNREGDDVFYYISRR